MRRCGSQWWSWWVEAGAPRVWQVQMRRRTVLYGFTKPRFMSRAPIGNKAYGFTLPYPSYRLFFLLSRLRRLHYPLVVPSRADLVPVRVCAAHPSTRQRPARCSRVLYVLISAYPDLCALWPRGEHPERCSKWGNAARPRGACAECAVEGAHGGHTLK